MTQPPLTLYIHLPWCVRKCPYCDFNSHKAPAALPEAAYIAALLADLEGDIARWWELTGQETIQPLAAIFIGGGTPSLFQPNSLARLLEGVATRLCWPEGVEVTLEANPGTLERGRFSELRAIGINRLSLGVQSFQEQMLQRLGRIHGRREAFAAVEEAVAADFENYNIDLMYALPEQSLAEALADIDTALALEPPHLSHYQLTLEPQTLFHRYPPSLPDEELSWQMQEACQERLAAAGYDHYEVSAYAKPGHRCRHNLNYWRFGDYLGIGAGAHGKRSDAASGRVARYWKTKNPRDYLARAATPAVVGGLHWVAPAALTFEFMLNGLRLMEGVEGELFTQRTGRPLAACEPMLAAAVARGLLRDVESLRPTSLGQRFLDDLVALFMPPEEGASGVIDDQNAAEAANA